MPKLPFWLNLNTLSAGLIVALCIYIGIQKIELLTCRLHNKDYQAQLEKISDTKNRQAETTKGAVERAKVIYRDADKVAQRIEAAPLGKQCETPREILGADL